MLVLIPELCHMTGLTDEMRADFRVMKVRTSSAFVNVVQQFVCMYT